MTHPKLISPAAYEALSTYLVQWEAHEADPGHSREPDHKLLLVDPAHGPILGIELVTDPRDGALVADIVFHSDLGPRNPRRFDPTDAAAFRLAVAFKGGISVNDNTRRPEGRAFTRAKMSLWEKGEGQSLAIDLTRVILDAPAGREAVQRGEYHSLRRRDLALRMNNGASTTRADYLEAVAQYHRRYAVRTGIKVSTADHVANVRRFLELGDGRHPVADIETPEAAE